MHLSRLPVRKAFGREFSCCRRLQTLPVIKENDIVLLRRDSFVKPRTILTQPLQHGQKIKLDDRKAVIDADEIIGKHVRDSVIARGLNYRILQPSLAEYTDLSPRIVTPIYSIDASLIVSLLDLHPSRPGERSEKLEIFEAGTGHGALTLHLARVIHGANPPLPEDQTELEEWKTNRRAAVHTLDISQKHSDHAQITVKNFRNGIYFPNVDFHVGTIEEYLQTRLQGLSIPIFDHAILDLPNTHEYIGIVGKAMKSNGVLITFCPSITQINTCVSVVKQQNLPFYLEKVLEIGSANGVGGREWDVRFVMPRATQKSSERSMRMGEEGKEENPNAGLEKDWESLDEASVEPTSEDVPGAEIGALLRPGLEMVCRPKVGAKIAGGGFLGVWRRKNVPVEYMAKYG